MSDAPLCSICGKEPPRPGLKTGAACALKYARAQRARAERRREAEARRRVERAQRLDLASRIRFEVALAALAPGAPPVGFRAVPGMRLAVDSGGWRAMRRDADGGWRAVDLDASPLVSRAMVAMVERAWGEQDRGDM